MKAIDEIFRKFSGEFRQTVNKEFIPVLYIVASPILAFMNGYGIRTFQINIDLYYILPALFAVYMNRTEKLKMPRAVLFALLALLDVIMTLPFFQLENFSIRNCSLLIFSYAVILLFFIMVSASYILNDPYYAGYYATKNRSYRIIYIIIGAFFMGVAVFHLALFVKVLEILRITQR